MIHHAPAMGTLVNKTINDLVKEAIESIANDNIELEAPTHTTEKGDV
jgi:hypothetical protein